MPSLIRNFLRNVNLYEASTPLQLAALKTIIESEKSAGLLGKRVLLVSKNNQHPESEGPFVDCPESIALVRELFDEVYSLNELIYPMHPSTWKGDVESSHNLLHLLHRDSVKRLVVESLQVAPAQTLATLFPRAAISVYSDGLMSFSPTRFKLSDRILSRVDRVYYFPLLGEETPLLLREASPELIRLDTKLMGAYFADLATAAQVEFPDLSYSAVFLGQSLANSEICSEEEEVALYLQGLGAMKQRLPDNSELWFKPHGACSASVTLAVKREMELRHGVSLRILSGEVPIETYFYMSKPQLVGGLFSTALFLAEHIYGIKVCTVGTTELLGKLPKYENSNRIPIAVSSLMLPKLVADPLLGVDEGRKYAVSKEARFVQLALLKGPLKGELIRAVAFCMQPDILAFLEDELRFDAWFLPTLAGPHRVFFEGCKREKKELTHQRFALAKNLFEVGMPARAAYCACQALAITPQSSANLKLAIQSLDDLGERELCSRLTACSDVPAIG